MSRGGKVGDGRGLTGQLTTGDELAQRLQMQIYTKSGSGKIGLKPLLSCGMFGHATLCVRNVGRYRGAIFSNGDDLHSLLPTHTSLGVLLTQTGDKTWERFAHDIGHLDRNSLHVSAAPNHMSAFSGCISAYFCTSSSTIAGSILAVG